MAFQKGQRTIVKKALEESIVKETEDKKDSILKQGSGVIKLVKKKNLIKKGLRIC